MYVHFSKENLRLRQELVYQKLRIVNSQLIDVGHVAFTFQVSSEAGADGLTFYVDERRAMDLQSGATSFMSLYYNLTKGIHLLRWVYGKDASQNVGLDEAILTVRLTTLRTLLY